MMQRARRSRGASLFFAASISLLLAVTIVLSGCGGQQQLLSVIGGTVEPTLPASAPDGLVVSKYGSADIELAWNDNSEYETGFEVERNGLVTESSVAASAESFVDDGLTPDTEYVYRVRATYPEGESAWSDSVSVTPQVAAWAEVPSAVPSGPGTGSSFMSVAGDVAGNVYAAGYQYGTGSYTYGDQSIAGTASQNPVLVKYDSSGTAQWARTISAGTQWVDVYSVASDDSGNSYIAGQQSGTGTYTYGTQSATGVSTNNPIVVKYDPSGTALWARTISAGANSAWFDGVAVDRFGNVYVVGLQYGTGPYTYGSVGLTGPAGVNPVLVKYDSSGTALWARTIGSGTAGASFTGVALDGDNVYVVGEQSGTTTNTYGTVSVTGVVPNDNPVLLKYDSDGNAQWARTLTSGGNDATFASVAVTSGRVAVVGQQEGDQPYTYGIHVVPSPSISGSPVVVLYDTAGTALWARGLTAGPGTAWFRGVAIDDDGNVFVAGSQGGGNQTYTYGTIDIANASSMTGVLVLRYSATGEVLWGRTSTATPEHRDTSFRGVVVDGSGGVIAAGSLDSSLSSITYSFGNETAVGLGDSFDAVVVKWYR